MGCPLVGITLIMKKKERTTKELNDEIQGRWRAHQNESFEKTPKKGATGSISRSKQNKAKDKIDKIQQGSVFTKETLSELRKLKQEYKDL